MSVLCISETYYLQCLIMPMILLIILQAFNDLRRQRNQRHHIEDGHETDADIAQIPDEGVGGQATDKKHYQSQNLVERLGAPVVAEQIGHIGSGIKEDADKSGEAEQPQDYGNKDHACLTDVVPHGCL